MLLWFVIIAAVVLLDQLSKMLTVTFLKAMDTLPLWEDVLHLTYVENRGAAFGMLADQRWVFMVVSSVAIVAMLGYLVWRKPTAKLEGLAVAFIVGGGIGNMIDRVALGYVVDMIDFRLINFAVFNVADSFVCVGAGLLMLYLILSMVKEYRAEKATALAGETEAEPAADAEAGATEEESTVVTTAVETTTDETAEPETASAEEDDHDQADA